ncbi:MAG: winged helix-turn-helix transcriptional regulator, partial [Chloroflexi bacterium]|nr:winged helix-turn-helix transcriptional regulator [Chloroflexota bacterium]
TLWHRFGTPPGGKDPQTQKDYLSGTEEEFRVAYRLWKQYGRPRIVMYRCTRAISLDADLMQAQRVKDFFKEIQDPQGEFRVLTQSFDAPESFEKLLFDNLQKLLLEYGELESKQIPMPQILEDGIFRFADLVLNTKTREVTRGGRRVDLTAKEFDLLRYFMLHPREVLNREQIFGGPWNKDFRGESNIIEVYVRYLRTKLESNGEPRLIQTVRGVGYVLREE